MHAPGLTNHRQRLGALRKLFCRPLGRTVAHLPELPHNTRSTPSLRRGGVCSSGQLMKAETTCGCSLIEPEGHSRTLHQHSAPLTLLQPSDSQGFVVEALLHPLTSHMKMIPSFLSSCSQPCHPLQKQPVSVTSNQRLLSKNRIIQTEERILNIQLKEKITKIFFQFI